MPKEHPAFAGHFPGSPIVPGALLLRWMQQGLDELIPNRQLLAISSVKFLAAVKPTDELSLCGNYSEEADKVTVQIHNQHQLVCRAALRLVAKTNS